MSMKLGYNKPQYHISLSEVNQIIMNLIIILQSKKWVDYYKFYACNSICLSETKKASKWMNHLNSVFVLLDW